MLDSIILFSPHISYLLSLTFFSVKSLSFPKTLFYSPSTSSYIDHLIIFPQTSLLPTPTDPTRETRIYFAAKKYDFVPTAFLIPLSLMFLHFLNDKAYSNCLTCKSLKNPNSSFLSNLLSLLPSIISFVDPRFPRHDIQR